MTGRSTQLLPVVFLMGPTAAGKSSTALPLAERFDAEIISVDSAQVYRGMDIGTAKPSAEARARIPHHLLDIVEPSERYSAGRFRRDAIAEIDATHARGRLPLLVGGTMLYFKALEDGLADLPDADPQLRVELDRRAESEGWPALHAELARLDPESASRIRANDRQRIQRALEICLVTGDAASRLQARMPPEPFPYPLLKIALVPRDREGLRRRIEARFTTMMDAGLLEEVRALRSRPDVHAELPSMRSVGYRQLWQYLDGACSLDDAVRWAVAATRRLARRQLTWLRSMGGVSRIDPTEDDSRQRLELAIKALVSKG